jgi:methyl-accepting chemotaxis protein
MFNSIRKKILAGNLLLLGILLVVLLYALNQVNMNQQFLAKQKTAEELLIQIHDIEKLYLKYQAASLAYLVLENESNKKDHERYARTLSKQLSSVSHKAINELEPKFSRYNKQIEHIYSLYSGTDKAGSVQNLEQAGSTFKSMLTTLESLQTAQKLALEAISKGVHSSTENVSFAIYLLLVIMVVFGIGISLITSSIITRGLVALQTTIEEIEKNNDLTQAVDITSNDEIGFLAAAFNRLIRRLLDIVTEVKQRSEQLATSSEELSVVTEQSKMGLQQQSDAITQVAAAIQEMEYTVQEIAGNAENATTAANDGNSQAQHGNTVVNQATTSIDELSTEIQRSAEVVSKLKDESERIGSVLSVINAIAEQTNLLALNAAIEAARAGEQGRGFAVVADEVRVLAQKTQESTRDIESSIQSLQQGTHDSVEVMKASQDKAESTVQHAQEAGEALNKITSAVSEILMMNTMIASASEEQSSTTQEINQNITNIQSIAEQTASGAEQTSAASTQLSQLSVQLQAIVSQFKI